MSFPKISIDAANTLVVIFDYTAKILPKTYRTNSKRARTLHSVRAMMETARVILEENPELLKLCNDGFSKLYVVAKRNPEVRAELGTLQEYFQKTANSSKLREEK